MLFCLDPPDCRSDVAVHDLTPLPAGLTSDVTAAALLSYWLELRWPHPWLSPSP